MLEHLVDAKTHEQEEIHDWPKEEELQFARRDVIERVVHRVPLDNFAENRAAQVKPGADIEEKRQVAK